MVVGEREPIDLALRRFRKLLERNRASHKWHKPVGWRGSNCHVRPCDVRRTKRHRKKIKAQLATLRAKEVGEQ